MTEQATGGSEDLEGLARALLEEVARLAVELRPELARREIGLDSSLERDLGLDSLGRVELVVRLADRFGGRLVEDEVMVAETPGELLALLQAGTGDRVAVAELPGVRLASGSGAIAAPARARTLPEVLAWHADRHPERTHVLLCEDDRTVREMGYGELHSSSLATGAGLAELGVEPGEAVAVMLPTGLDYFASFYGILQAGAIPVPLYPPVRPSQLEDHLLRQARILDNCRARLLVTVPEARPLARILKARVASLRGFVTPGDLRRPGGTGPGHAHREDDVAFLQYTSGSTGEPKGVALTHRNLLANLRGILDWLRLGSDDVCVSWLPLYHDMGLIGAGMGSLYGAFPLVLMSPLAFLSRPVRWLRRISEHRGTVAAGPNFAYELCLSKVSEEELAGLDLSSWRLALNGAEAVLPSTLERFAARFAAVGFRREALLPVYGLAESSLGVTFPPPGRGPLIDRAQRAALTEGMATPAGADGGASAGGAGAGDAVVELVSCGVPLAGHEVRIADTRGRELPERTVGRVQFRGPSACRGYYRNPEATRRLFDGEWLQSGDLGYLADGELYITGREKDVIIRSGRNLSPAEIEEAASSVAGVRAGCVAAFGLSAADGAAAGTERLVVVAETRASGAVEHAPIRRAVLSAVAERVGVAPDEVVLAAPGAVLKTSSGKIRRGAMRELYRRGEIGRRRTGAGWQVASLAVSSLGPASRRAARGLGRALYTAWVYAAFALLGAPLWLLAACLPGLRLRQATLRATARLLVGAAFVPFRTQGLEHLPGAGAAVLAVNHTSYSDVVFLIAALPPGWRWVAKSEWARHPLLRFLFGRVGCVFVERFDARRSAGDARLIVELLGAGARLALFPEGTFSRRAGLLPFRMGAFASAAQSGAPVVPAVLRGARSLMRDRQRTLHRRPISLTVLPSIVPRGAGWDASVRLRDETRAAILGACGEPDLAEP
ncbi:MAG TPA: AMP-binding protein [Thermoanaerobaculia bacterium]|nr:AMP-binding protein [Thermoanaerobaculia bacterium]